MSKSLVPNSTSQQELTRIFRMIEQELMGLRKAVASSGSTSQAASTSSSSGGQQQTIQNISYIGPKGRRHVLASTPILTYYQTAYVECEFTESCDMISVKSSHPAWIRVYSSAAARLEDASRPYSADPLPGHGIMGEVATYEPDFLEIGFSPVPFFNNNDTTIGKTAYIAVTSMATGYAGVIDLDFSILPQEQTGASGMQGKTGLNGRDGVNGVDGRTILSGTTDPGPADGANGDYFLKNGTTLFGPKAAGVWPAGISLIGPPGTNGLNGAPGADGNTLLYGAADPGPTDGVNGNYWINNTTHTLFGPKAAGAWPAGVSLVGPAGAAGAGVPVGGTTHQVLRKVNATDLNTEWADPASGLPLGGTTGQALVKLSNADLDAGWGTVSGGGGGVFTSPSGMYSVGCGQYSGSCTTGCSFIPTTSSSCSGVRFYGKSGHTYKLSLWDASNTRLANVSVAVGSDGVATGSFSSPVSLTAFATYRVSIWDTNAANYISGPVGSAVITAPYIMSDKAWIKDPKLYGSGDVAPSSTAGAEYYPVEPILS